MAYDFYVRSRQDLIDAIQKVGIIPYFSTSIPGFSLGEFPYLLQDCQTLPKTPEKTEMVLRFPLGFA
jgi:hypothetical protein